MLFLFFSPSLSIFHVLKDIDLHTMQPRHSENPASLICRMVIKRRVVRVVSLWVRLDRKELSKASRFSPFWTKAFKTLSLSILFPDPKILLISGKLAARGPVTTLWSAMNWRLWVVEVIIWSPTAAPAGIGGGAAEAASKEGSAGRLASKGPKGRKAFCSPGGCDLPSAARAASFAASSLKRCVASSTSTRRCSASASSSLATSLSDVSRSSSVLFLDNASQVSGSSKRSGQYWVALSSSKEGWTGNK